MKILTLLAVVLLSGCASMHGCDVGVGFGGPHMHCDPTPAPAPEKAAG